ncbi:MAG: cupin domain-containing protein [Devosia sp.]|jgi:predicted cupin superfamily sugar epimerase|nr:cupin domain-containing protein [Devosiaceae bacterium]
MNADLSASDVIRLLELERHPEGGWYRQTFADPGAEGERHLSTAIYYLLEGADVSAWHRVDAAEVWHWHAGAPLRLRLSHEGKVIDEHILGPDLKAAERPQVVVPRHCWQTAKCLGAWTLVGCTVAPGFQFSGFEMADEDWEPGE